jgi:hypothetical protein
MNETEVGSWAELQDRLFEGSWNEGLGRFRPNHAFRGTDDTSYPLETSITRLGGDVEDLERHLLRNFRKYAGRDAVEQDSLWHWLSVAKHHGLPTRLLDWTHSPFVAMHFATADTERFGADGAIWVVDYVEAHKLLPEELQDGLAEEGSNLFTVEMLSGAVGSLEDLDRMHPPGFVGFFEPPSVDERIVNQYALLSFMSDPRARLDRWLEERPGLWKKIVIPAELKWEVRDKLDQANVTERVLFPGLDGLSSWLKRHYTPKKGGGQKE